MMAQSLNASPMAPYKFDLEKCEEHRKANSYGMPLNFRNKCQCCGRYSQKEPLTATFQPLKVYYSGSQIPSFLVFLKYFTILFGLLCLVFALPLTIINYNGGGCESIVICSYSNFIKFSVFNSFNQPSNLQLISYLQIPLSLLLILTVLLIRKATNSIQKQIDEADLFASSYTAYLKLPKQYGNQNTIQDQIEKWWLKELNYSKDKLINLFPQLYNKFQIEEEMKYTKIKRETEKTEDRSKKPNLRQKIIENILFYDSGISNRRQIILEERDKQVQMFNYEMRKTQLQREQKIRQLSKSKFCLVLFKKKQYAKYFTTKTTPSQLQKIILFNQFREFYLNRKEVKVQKDIYPSEIYWENQNITKMQQIKSQLLSYLFVLVSLVCNIGTFSGISLLLNKCISNHDGDLDRDDIPFISNYFYVLSSLSINIITYVFNQLIYYYSSTEKHQTYSHKQAMLVGKTIFHNISTMFFMPFLTFKLMKNRFLWVENGFLETSNWILLIYMMFSLIQKYISPRNLLSIYRYRKTKENNNLTQKEANQRYQKPKMRIEQKYATILTVIYLNLFNLSFSPYMIFITTIWLLLQFWLQKINIAYYYSEDEYHGNLLIHSIIKIMQYFFLPLAIGTLSVYCVGAQFSQLDDITVVVIVESLIVFVGVVFAISPLQKISQTLFSCRFKGVQYNKSQIMYSQIQSKFLSRYEQYQKATIWQLKDKNEAAKKEKIKSSENVKQEMKQIQKNLTNSLKQQLKNHKIPLLQKKETREENQYYEYQRKVEMKKTIPKIAIPSLLQKAPDIFNHKQTIKQSEPEKLQGKKERNSTMPKINALNLYKNR